MNDTQDPKPAAPESEPLKPGAKPKSRRLRRWTLAGLATAVIGVFAWQGLTHAAHGNLGGPNCGMGRLPSIAAPRAALATSATLLCGSLAASRMRASMWPSGGQPERAQAAYSTPSTRWSSPITAKRKLRSSCGSWSASPTPRCYMSAAEERSMRAAPASMSACWQNMVTSCR